MISHGSTPGIILVASLISTQVSVNTANSRRYFRAAIAYRPCSGDLQRTDIHTHLNHNMFLYKGETSTHIHIILYFYTKERHPYAFTSYYVFIQRRDIHTHSHHIMFLYKGETSICSHIILCFYTKERHPYAFTSYYAFI